MMLNNNFENNSKHNAIIADSCFVWVIYLRLNNFANTHYAREQC